MLPVTGFYPLLIPIPALSATLAEVTGESLSNLVLKLGAFEKDEKHPHHVPKTPQVSSSSEAAGALLKSHIDSGNERYFSCALVAVSYKQLTLPTNQED